MSRIDHVINEMQTYQLKPDIELIKKAYEFAEECHKDQKRASGEPYIVHPVGVAKILAEMKMDSMTVAAGLLHDVVEDCDVTTEDIKKKFGQKISFLVEAVTKLEQFNFASKKQASLENFRKLFLIMAEEARVVFIKLADRLYNMRTLEHKAPKDQKRIASETMDIYAPLAERLGMGQIKGELADLSFKYLQPQKFKKISRDIAGAVQAREKNIKKLIIFLNKKFAEEKISVQKIEGRAKHIYSTYKKLERVEDISKVYDLIAVRILVDTVEECYRVLGIIHQEFKPMAGNFKDYISVPKPNGYRSLHTTVFGVDGLITEVQIRTVGMHEEAEEGLAAHWHYSETKVYDPKKYKDRTALIATPEERLSWVKALSEWQKNISLPEFEEHLKVDLFKHRILVLSPKGDVYELPADSTPVDFAFAVHSELGYKINGAKVHGKIVTLDHHLLNRDVVEILTSKVLKGPSLDWLNFVKSSHAKSQIKSWFKKMNRSKNLETGKKLLEEEIAKFVSEDFNGSIKKLESIFQDFNLHSVEDLYIEVGEGNITTSSVLRKLISAEKFEPKKRVIKTVGRDAEAVVVGTPGVKVRLATCCKPNQGDSISGYITRGRGITAHKVNCKNLPKLEQERMVNIVWNKTHLAPASIKIIGKNRVGLLRDIAHLVSDMNVNILNVSTQLLDDRTSEISMSLELTDTSMLVDIFRKIDLIADVKKVYRV